LVAKRCKLLSKLELGKVEEALGLGKEPWKQNIQSVGWKAKG
jgi:hypothetical protein